MLQLFFKDRVAYSGRLIQSKLAARGGTLSLRGVTYGIATAWDRSLLRSAGRDRRDWNSGRKIGALNLLDGQIVSAGLTLFSARPNKVGGATRSSVLTSKTERR
jgi:hypothetical protein